MKLNIFFKGAGQALEIVGSAAGSVMHKSCQTLAQTTGIQEIEKIGNLAQASTTQTGKILGNIVESCGLIAEGVITDDDQLAKNGITQIGQAVKTTAIGVGKGGVAAVGMAVSTFEAIADGDYDKAKESAKNVGLLVAATVIGVGIVEGLDVLEHTDIPENTHSVDPHYVNDYIRADGTHVEGYWRDGDGDTSINLDKAHGGGYLQGNPDGILSNNLKG